MSEVYDGELQVRGLGLDVHIYNDDGKEVFQEQGELICGKPFPSMPLYFWNDSDGAKYFGACTYLLSKVLGHLRWAV